MSDKNPVDILRQAAVAADALLPALERQRAEAIKKVEEIDRNISLLRAVSTSSASITSSSVQLPLTVNVPVHESRLGLLAPSHGIGLANERNERFDALTGNSLMDRIKTVLSIRGDLLPMEIANEIKTLFNYDVPLSSLYAALGRGKTRGTLIEGNGLWNISKRSKIVEALLMQDKK